MSSSILPSRSELMSELRMATERVDVLFRSLKPEDMERPVAGLDWNVGETAVHLVVIARRGVNDLRRSSTTDELADLNALTIREIEERDPVWLADKFSRTMTAALDKVFANIPDDLVFEFHGGSQMTVFSAMGVVLGELLIHGNDIAQAVGMPWSISAHQAALVFASGLSIFSKWLVDDALTVTETYRVHFKGDDLVVLLRIADGAFTVENGNGKDADYVLHVEPVEFIFTFPYGRQPSTNPDVQRLCSRFKPL